MGRYRSGGMLLKDRSWAMILPCLLVFAFLSSSVAHGISVDPVLDRVISITKLNESKDTGPSDNRPGADKSGNGAQPDNTAPSSHKSSPVVVNNTPEFMPTVVANPMPELPPVETFETWQTIARMSEPVPLRVKSPAALDVVAKPVMPSILQSSNHGWKVFGVAWYVWILAGGASWYATRWAAYWWRRRTLAG